MSTAQVVVPELETLVEIQGSTPLATYAQYITFDGITFAHSDWNLYEVDNSFGYASSQGCVVVTAFADSNWHNDIYRSNDLPPAAVHVTTAKNIEIINGSVTNTGCLGIHMENDVWDCTIEGNYIANTGGSGIVIGHPTHVYENDTDIHVVTNANSGEDATNAGIDKEKFPAGTESVPKNIYIRNNFLQEVGELFSGNVPITTFYTQGMYIEHNFVYTSSYSAISAGWGWCNFDGDEDATSSNNLPGVPSDTSFDNHINYNRVEELCSVLHDGGGIYTLGQQGKSDWTDYTEMNNNYINATRDTAVAEANRTASRAINGFHPDEGSAYIKMDGNVITNIAQNTYELNNWKRKHDVTVTNSYSDIDSYSCTAPNCSVEQYVNSSYTWPENGYDTVRNSGLEDEYVYMIGKDVIADTEYELASNVQLKIGDNLSRRGLLTAEDTVWIAPEGTSEFAEGDTMTKAAGNTTEMDIPAIEGSYKLYIDYEDDMKSIATSSNTLYIGEVCDPANVTEGGSYSISTTKPLVLDLDEYTYTFTLNDEDIVNGYEISTVGSWVLKGTEFGQTTESVTINFTTYMTEANQLLPENLIVKPGMEITLGTNLNDSSKTIWLAQTGVTEFESYPADEVSSVSGDSGTIIAPNTESTVDLTVVDSKGDILSRSDATIEVLDYSDVPPTPIIRLAAGEGTNATTEGSAVTQWTSSGSSDTEVIMAQSDTDMAPTLQYEDNGAPYLNFDGVDQNLKYEGFDFNDEECMTIVIVSRNNQDDYGDSDNYSNGRGSANSPFYAPESSGWGSMYLTPYQDWIGMRFGTGSSSAAVKVERTSDTGISVVGGVKDEDEAHIYIDGVNSYTAASQSATTAGIDDVLYVGCEYAKISKVWQYSYFEGDIFEILVYDRALSSDEMDLVNRYMEEKYLYEAESEYTAVNEITDVETSLVLGETLTLSGTVSPTNAVAKDIEWSVVSGDGTIIGNDLTATATGSIVVKATITDGLAIGQDYTQEFTIQVVAEAEPEYIAVNEITDVETKLILEETLALSGTVSPADATAKDIEWSIVSGDGIINDNILSSTVVGSIIVKATIKDGLAIGQDYTQEFTIQAFNGGLPTGYTIQFSAEDGLTMDGESGVSAWKSTAGDYTVTVPSVDDVPTVEYEPTLNHDENGAPFLSFDGENDKMFCDGINFNDLSEMTILMLTSTHVSHLSEATYNNSSGMDFTPFGADDGGWSGLFLTPYQEWIGARFGTGSKPGGQIKYEREESIGDATTMTGAVKNNLQSEIYVDGELKYETTTASATTANIGTTLRVGYSVINSVDRLFDGDIYEIIVYDRALSSYEMQEAYKYLEEKYMGCNHILTKTEEKPATCTETGIEAYWTCEVCGKLFSDEAGTTEIDAPIIIPVKSHTLVKTEEKAATYTETGTEAYWTCEVCGKLFSDEAGTTEIDAPIIIAVKKHTLVKTEEKVATCTETGTEAYWTCEVCGKLFSDEAGTTEIDTPIIIAMNNHTLVKVEEKSATNTETGTEAYWMCEVCGKLFSDEAGTTEIDAPITIAKTTAITAGAGSKYKIGASKNLTVTCSGALADLTGIYVDGKLVDPSNYTLKSGSTILTLKSSYLDTLSVGKHTVKFQYIDDVAAASVEFTIKAKTTTSDSTTDSNSTTTSSSGSTESITTSIANEDTLEETPVLSIIEAGDFVEAVTPETPTPPEELFVQGENEQQDLDTDTTVESSMQTVEASTQTVEEEPQSSNLWMWILVALGAVFIAGGVFVYTKKII
jgi:rubrerythrin